MGCSEELGIGLAGQFYLGTIIRNLRTMEVLGKNRLGFDLIKENYKIKDGQLEMRFKAFGLGVSFDFEQLRIAGQDLGFQILNDFSNKQELLNATVNYFYIRTKGKLYNGLLLLQKRIMALRWRK